MKGGTTFQIPKFSPGFPSCRRRFLSEYHSRLEALGLLPLTLETSSFPHPNFVPGSRVPVLLACLALRPCFRTWILPCFGPKSGWVTRVLLPAFRPSHKLASVCHLLRILCHWFLPPAHTHCSALLHWRLTDSASPHPLTLNLFSWHLQLDQLP